MSIVITSSLTILLGVLFLILAIQFKRGKWLRLLAGNTFNDFTNDQSKKLGQSTSYCMYLSSVFCFILSYSFIYENLKLLCFVAILVFFIGCIGIIYAFRSWLKNG